MCFQMAHSYLRQQEQQDNTFLSLALQLKKSKLEGPVTYHYQGIQRTLVLIFLHRKFQIITKYYHIFVLFCLRYDEEGRRERLIQQINPHILPFNYASRINSRFGTMFRGRPITVYV